MQVPDPNESWRIRWSGLILVVGSAQFALAMVMVQLFYPGYSDLLNPISDLGNSMLSPLAWLYNASIIATGVAGLLAMYYMVSAFPRRLSRHVAFGFFAIGNVGLILLGIFPENTTILGGWAHSLAGQLAFPSYAVSIILMMLAMRHEQSWKNYGWFTLTLGFLSLVAVLIYGFQSNLGLGAGGMERLFLGADLVWLLVIGIRLFRLPTIGSYPKRNAV